MIFVKLVIENMGRYAVFSVQAFHFSIVRGLEQVWLEIFAEMLNMLDYVCHREVKECQEVTEEKIYADSITENEVSSLGKTYLVEPTDLIPGSFFLFLLKGHTSYQINCCQSHRNIRFAVISHRYAFKFKDLKHIAQISRIFVIPED